MPKTEAFNKLQKALKKQYLGEQVPKIYRDRYGKTYTKKDIESLSFAIAKSRGIRIEK